MRQFIQALNRINSLFTAKRVFVYAMVLAGLTYGTLVAVYTHVPHSVEEPGADFVQFYSAAKLARIAPEQVYDTEAQIAMQKRFSTAARNGVHWPYLHAPFFTIILLPLNLFSYREAYWVWTGSALTLYLLSIMIQTGASRVERPSLKMLFAVAGASPALVWLLLTGQTTAIALFLWTVAIHLAKQGRFYWSGFVLGGLLYRAQYLTIVVPLLLYKRLGNTFSGLITSCLILLILGGAVFSINSYVDYFKAIERFSARITSQEQPLSHYITLYGFFRPLMPHLWAIVCTVAVSLLLLFWLWVVWRKPVLSSSDSVDLRWAMLVMTTLLLMHHGFVYDLILLTIPMLALFQYRSLLSPCYKIILFLLYFAPYALLFFTDVLPFNPIQPLLVHLCFEIYSVHVKLGQRNGAESGAATIS